FATTVAIGATDISSAAFAGTYATPSLALGASVTLTVRIRYADVGCFEYYLNVSASAGSVTNGVALHANAAA
ncbi:MAG: hypothetical protein QOJ34_248, partial [Pseudonocardiales bacterium]|nr:hypothetical protein [Pseudonocardiales bacterium]